MRVPLAYGWALVLAIGAASGVNAQADTVAWPMEADSIHVLSGGPSEDTSLPEPLPLDTAHRSNGLPFHGRVEAGALFGRQPNTFYNGDVNLTARGLVSFDVLGMPLGLDFDVNTATPYRGRGSNVRLVFDAERQARLRQLRNGVSLDAVLSRKDSLLARRGELERSVLGLERSIDHASGMVPPPWGVEAPAVQPPTLDTTLSMRAPAVPPDTLLQEVRPPAMPAVDTTAVAEDVRRMRARLDAVRAELQRVDSALAEVRMLEERGRAMVDVTKHAETFAERSAFVLEKLEVGDCTPDPSEFLVNGMSLRGVAARAAFGGTHLSVAHGKSYDDMALLATPEQQRSRELQRLFFLDDPTGADPRKLTTVSVQHVLREGAYVGLGLLRGERSDALLGSDIAGTDGLGRQRNHVLQVEGGVRVGKAHALDLTVAGSMDRFSTDATVTERPPEERKGTLQAMAAVLAWESDLERTGTLLRIEGRAIGDSFNSMGVAFLRQGSRSGSLDVTQRLGKALRLRAGYKHEVREPIGDSGAGMTMDRARLALSARVGRRVTLRAACLPQRSTMGTMVQDHLMTSFGGDVRTTLGGMSLRMDGEVAEYRMRTDAMGSTLRSIRGGVALATRRAELGVRCNSWSGAATTADGSDISLIAKYAPNDRIVVDIQAMLPNGSMDDTAFDIRVKRDMRGGLSLMIKASRIVRSDLFFNDPLLMSIPVTYNCGVLASYTW